MFELVDTNGAGFIAPAALKAALARFGMESSDFVRRSSRRDTRVRPR